MVKAPVCVCVYRFIDCSRQNNYLGFSAAAHDGGADRWREDTAICRAKLDWPEAKSGPAVTSVKETGMREKGWVGGVGWKEKECWCSAGCGNCYCLSLMTMPLDGDEEINKQWVDSSCMREYITQMPVKPETSLLL